MSMGLPTTPAEMRAYIVERLVGEIGEPDRVTETARALIEGALPAVVEGLKRRLAVDLSIELVGVELSRMADARPEGIGSAMTVGASGAVQEALVLSMDADAVALIVSALFGGDPGIAIAAIDRDLSPTETVVASRVFEEIAVALNETGARSLDVTLPLARAICGEEIAKQVLRDGPGVRIALAVSAPAGKGAITLTIPQRLLLKGSAAEALETGPAPQWRQRFGEEVMRSGVELQATMPLGRMTLGQISNLRAGQVIEFDADAQSHAKLSARQKTLFVCEFGKLGQNYTVRVRHPFDAGQEIMEGLVASR